MSTPTFIDLIYLSVNVNYTAALSIPVGCSDHNMVIIAKKAKLPKAMPKHVLKKSYENFSQNAFVKDIGNLCWSNVYKTKNTDEALEILLNILLSVFDKHAPFKKLTLRRYQAQWVDQELKIYMQQRNNPKLVAQQTKFVEDKQEYNKPRISVIRFNIKKKQYFAKLEKKKGNPKYVLKTLNLMEQKYFLTTNLY